MSGELEDLTLALNGMETRHQEELAALQTRLDLVERCVAEPPPSPYWTPKERAELETMVLPNGKFLLILGNVLDQNIETLQRMDAGLNTIADQIGAVGCIVFSMPVMAQNAEVIEGLS